MIWVCPPRKTSCTAWVFLFDSRPPQLRGRGENSSAFILFSLPVYRSLVGEWAVVCLCLPVSYLRNEKAGGGRRHIVIQVRVLLGDLFSGRPFLFDTLVVLEMRLPLVWRLVDPFVFRTSFGWCHWVWTCAVVAWPKYHALGGAWTSVWNWFWFVWFVFATDTAGGGVGAVNKEMHVGFGVGSFGWYNNVDGGFTTFSFTCFFFLPLVVVSS